MVKRIGDSEPGGEFAEETKEYNENEKREKQEALQKAAQDKTAEIELAKLEKEKAEALAKANEAKILADKQLEEQNIARKAYQIAQQADVKKRFSDSLAPATAVTSAGEAPKVGYTDIATDKNQLTTSAISNPDTINVTGSTASTLAAPSTITSSTIAAPSEIKYDKIAAGTITPAEKLQYDKIAAGTITPVERINVQGINQPNIITPAERVNSGSYAGINEANSANEQQFALELAKQSALGNTPSVAEIQQNMGFQQALAAQRAALASNRGGNNAAIARSTNANLANLNAQNVQQNALLRAEEQAKAREMYGNSANQTRAAEQNLLINREKDALTANLANISNAIEIAKKNGDLELASSLANQEVSLKQQLSNASNALEVNRLNVANSLASQQLNQGAGLDVNKINAANALEVNRLNVANSLASQQLNQGAGIDVSKSNVLNAFEVNKANAANKLTVDLSNVQNAIEIAKKNGDLALASSLANQEVSLKQQIQNIDFKVNRDKFNSENAFRVQQANQLNNTQIDINNANKQLEAAEKSGNFISAYALQTQKLKLESDLNNMVEKNKANANIFNADTANIHDVAVNDFNSRQLNQNQSQFTETQKNLMDVNKYNQEMENYRLNRQIESGIYVRPEQETDWTGAIISGLTTLGAGAMVAMSDKRKKKNIKPADKDIFEVLDKLDPYNYNYKDETYGKGDFIGVMAQDLEKSKKGKAIVVENDEGYKMLDTNKLLQFAIASIAALNKKIDKK